MKGKSLANEKAKLIVESRRQGRDYRLLREDCDEIGDGSWWDESRADHAVEQLIRLKDELLANHRRLDVNSFDRDACMILHRDLALPPNLAADDGF